AAVAGGAHVRVRGAGDDAGELRGAAAEGRGDVHAGDVRPGRVGSRDRRMRSVKMKTLHCTVALAALLASSCGGKKGTDSGGGGPVVDPAYVQHADAPDGIDLRVSDGE